MSKNGYSIKAQTIGLVVGPALCLLFLLLSHSQQIMPAVAWATAAIALWMAVWWMTEPVPVPVTALLPLASFDLLGIASIKETASAYAHPIIIFVSGCFYFGIGGAAMEST